MGARIEAVATVRSRKGPFARRALKLADAAAKACLERAGCLPADLELLINTGVYRDDNLGEPALASMIQDDILANRRPSSRTQHGTFSFDVQNGGAGVITALYLLDGFLQGSIGLGMVVASDADPGSPVEPRFPFAPVGGALLLTPGPDDGGFVDFEFATFPEHEAMFSAYVNWHKRPVRRGGRNVLVIDEHPGYADRLIDCASLVTRKFLKRRGLTPASVDLLVPSPMPERFPDALADQLDIAAERVARVSDELAGAHTAGPIAAYEAAERAGRLAEAKNVLFVAAGAGISVGAALYRNWAG